MQKNKNKVVFVLIIIVFGCFSIYSIYNFIQTKTFKKNAIQATGHVTQYEEYKKSSSDTGRYTYMYTPVAEYTTENGVTYTVKSSLSTNSKPYPIGGEVPILYDPINPQKAIFDTVGSVYGDLTFGTVTLLILFILVIARIKQAQKETWLRSNGKNIEATVVDVVESEPVERKRSMNRILIRRQYTIIAQWTNPLDNKTYKFVSDFFDQDLRHLLKDRPIDVLIDPNNPKKYFIDSEKILSRYTTIL